MTDHLMRRGDRDALEDDEIDWLAAGQEAGLAPEEAYELYDRACEMALAQGGDQDTVAHLFRQLLAERRRRAPGRMPRTLAVGGGKRLRLRGRQVPGKRAVTAALPPVSDPELRRRLQWTFGDEALDVPIAKDDGRVGNAEAGTVDGVVYLNMWGDAESLVRMGHEVAHALQQRRGRSEAATDSAPPSPWRRANLEAEAEHAGHAFAEGMPFSVRQAAPAASMLMRGGTVPGNTDFPIDPGPEPAPQIPADEQPGQRKGERPQDQAPAEGARADAQPAPDAQVAAPAQAQAPAPAGDAAGDGGAAGGAAGGGGGGGGAAVGGDGAAEAAGVDSGGAAGGDGGDLGSILSTLTRAKPSTAEASLTGAQGATDGALQSMRDEAQQEMPNIDTPTGLPARGAPADAAAQQQGADAGSVAREPTTAPQAQQAAQPREPETLVREAPAGPPSRPTVLAGGGAEPKQGEQPANDPQLANSAQGALRDIRLGGERIPTKASEVPNVELKGETDPKQMDTQQATANRDTAAAVAEAQASTTVDRGEGDIFPAAATAEKITAELAPVPAGAKVGAAGAVGAGGLPAEALASIDAEGGPPLAEKLGPEYQTFQQGKAQQDQAAERARTQANEKIKQSEAETQQKQTAAQRAAKAESKAARAQWKKEIATVDKDFKAKAKQAQEQHRRGVSNEQQQANKKAADHIKSAEREADAEKRKADGEVQKKKEEGKQSSGGFWGWVKQKAKALIDGIKAAVNFIYDNLRKAVKAIFDAYKKLALAVIDLARKAIKLLIKAFGEILKGLVRVALAAFPKLRDRFLRAIDQAVTKAQAAVDAAADFLKKAVTAIIDFLAKTIDSILGLIQGLYNAALTVIGMIITGELKELLQKIGQLIDAAKTAPGQFETAAYEELLGGDLDQPLSSAELIAAGRTPPPELIAAEMAGGGDAAPAEGGAEGTAPEGEAPPADAAAPAPAGEEMPKPPWSEDNVGVDAVAEESLDEEVEEDLLEQTNGEDGVVDLGGSDDESRSMEAILGTEGAKEEGAAQGGEQSAQPSPAPAVAPASAKATDGLNPRERAAIKWTLMKKGLADWWSKNWPYVLAGGVIGVAGFIVANILTGGAILAALPAIMTVVGYVMMGMAALKIAGHIQDFLTKGWAGDIPGGGKSLAKGLAAGAIELIMWLTFKAGAAAVRAGKAAAKGVVKGAQAAAKGVAKGATATAKLASAAVKASGKVGAYIIKGGKVLLKGISNGISKGIKKIRELGARLLAKTRFKGFRIRVAGRRFFIEAKINPWIVIAQGQIKVSAKQKAGHKYVDDDELKALQEGGKADPTKLNEWDARVYKETTASKGVGKVGDGLTGDHIPSRASLVEAWKLKNPGKPVPEGLINDEGVTVVLKGNTHAELSRTYAGRNTASQIAADAGNLAKAFEHDCRAILQGLHNDGKLTMEIVGAYRAAYNMNVAKGVFSHSADIDRLLTQMAGLAAK